MTRLYLSQLWKVIIKIKYSLLNEPKADQLDRLSYANLSCQDLEMYPSQAPVLWST